jgi:hypothetical protein
VSTDAPSCHQISDDLREPLTGSAAHAPTWLLVEHPGPWPATAPKDVTWPDDLGAELTDRADRLGIRLGLIRRPDRSAAHRRSTTDVLMVHTGPDRPWLRRLRLPDPVELLALDLQGLADGRAPYQDERNGPVLVVCAHGSRDACCARVGRGVAAALADRFGEAVWETTHLGGHRFAANLACFPHGLVFGRVDAGNATAIAEAYHHGRITLEHYRGRSCWPGPVQAAEQWLRGKLNVTEIDAVRVLGYTGHATTEVELAAGGNRHRVLVETVETAPARPFSCGSTKLEMPPAYRIMKPGSPAGPGG